jgi:hypothetical protein
MRKHTVRDEIVDPATFVAPRDGRRIAGKLIVSDGGDSVVC